jgi:Sulfotransferase domain
MPFETTASSTEAMRKMKEALCKLETEEGRTAGLSLKPQPGDVILSTPPKCGTTLLCAIAHSLRSQGDMSFEEINIVIPCLEMAWDSGLKDLESNDQGGHRPRLFKTHSWYPDCPKGDGVRYIVVARNPLDAGLSFYHFLGGWFFDPGEISVDEFLQEFMLARGAPENNMQNASQWHNMASWYPYRKDPNVLFVFYEDLVANQKAGVDLIADFLKVKHDSPELRQIAVEQSSIAYMKKFPTKHDEHMLKEARNVACGLHPRAGLDGRSAGKVRDGVVGKGKEIVAPETVEAFQKKWDDVMLPATGYVGYDEFRKGINSELGRTF